MSVENEKLSDLHAGSERAESCCDGKTDFAAADMTIDIPGILSAAGTAGVAAAAAIASSQNKRKLCLFETDPSKRKRHENRLLRKLKLTMEEFVAKVGQQAVVLVTTPGKLNKYQVFGAKPLEGVIKNLQEIITDDLESALAHQVPAPIQEDLTLFELPPILIDGIPSSVEKLTQAQLRSFIPLMLKYSTGHNKPNWGKESSRPPWWPEKIPWANIRTDGRNDEEKKKNSWTFALKQVVKNCYKFYGREDLLNLFTFTEEDKKVTVMSKADVVTKQCKQILLTNIDGAVTYLELDPNYPIVTLANGITLDVENIIQLQSENGGKMPLDVELNCNLDGAVNIQNVYINSDGTLGLTDLIQLSMIQMETVNNDKEKALIMTSSNSNNKTIINNHGYNTLEHETCSNEGTERLSDVKIVDYHK